MKKKNKVEHNKIYYGLVLCTVKMILSMACHLCIHPYHLSYNFCHFTWTCQKHSPMNLSLQNFDFYLKIWRCYFLSAHNFKKMWWNGFSLYTNDLWDYLFFYFICNNHLTKSAHETLTTHIYHRKPFLWALVTDTSLIKIANRSNIHSQLLLQRTDFN